MTCWLGFLKILSEARIFGNLPFSEKGKVDWWGSALSLEKKVQVAQRKERVSFGNLLGIPFEKDCSNPKNWTGRDLNPGPLDCQPSALPD